jgi:hypothetical protein
MVRPTKALRCSLPLLFGLVSFLSAPRSDAQTQVNVSPDGHETAICVCRAATPEESHDLRLSPDGWVQDLPRESFNRGTVPFPLVPDWVGTRVRATACLAWGDADHDGDQDLFVGTYWASQWPPLADYYNFIYLNTGGHLEANPSWISADQKHTSDAAWTRINTDAYPDLYCANGGSSFQASQVFYGRDGLLPNTAGWQDIGGTWTTGCAISDFDRDGDIDVATSNQGLSPNPYRPTYLYRNLGSALETAPSWQSSQVGITSDIDWGDMDGDGAPDLAVSGWSSWQTGVFRNLGTTLDPNFIWTTGHPERTDKGVGWAKVDSDSLADLVVGGNGGPDWLFDNEGTILGTTPVWSSGEVYTGCQDLAWADVDRDGDKDLAMIHFSTGHVRIYLNDNGVLPAIADWQYDAASSGTAIGFGDVNGDGWPDLAIGVANGPIELFINQRLPTGIGEDAADLPAPGSVRLKAGPNPSRDNFAIFLEAGDAVRLDEVGIYDTSGRRVAELAGGDAVTRRVHRRLWRPRAQGSEALSAGIYFVEARGLDSQGRAWEVRTRVVWLGR